MCKVTYTNIQYIFYVLLLNICVTAIFTYICDYLPRVYICVVVAQSVGELGDQVVGRSAWIPLEQ